jgi:ADP-ribose pyrophosphatase
MISDALTSASRPALDTPRFQVRLTEVPKRGGGTRTYGFLATADAVMIKNRRIACEQMLWEVPAGTIEPGEDPALCALREVEEETGYQAQMVTPIHGFFGCPGMVSEFLYAYVAQGLTQTAQDLDDTEEIEVHPMPLAQALDMIKDGTIRDAKSIATLLYYATFMKGAK